MKANHLIGPIGWSDTQQLASEAKSSEVAHGSNEHEWDGNAKQGRQKHDNEGSSCGAENDLPGGGPRRASSIERDQETAQKDVQLLASE